MIGFKELVQNFKDGLPELKDIGKEGLGILGDCAKVAGEFALEGAKAAGNFAADGAKYALGSGGLKLTESNERTMHEYTDWTLDDVQSDRDYLSMFKCAMDEVTEKRKYDDYVCGCIGGMLYDASVIRVVSDRIILWRLSFRGIRVAVGSEVHEVSRTVMILIQTPNVRQLAWNGGPLQLGYEVSYCGQRCPAKQKQLVKEIRLESFLGVVFRHDCCEFSIPDHAAALYEDNVVELKDVEAVDVKANKLLGFTDYQAIVASSMLVPGWKGKIVGMICMVSVASIGDAEEFMKKVRAIFNHKYVSAWTKEDKSGFFELGARFLHAMSVNGGKVYLTQTKDGVVKLMVISDAYGEYRRDVEDAYKDTAEYKQKLAMEQAKAAEKERVENERKADAERREQKRRDDLAEAQRKREGESAAREAEFSAALDAI